MKDKNPKTYESFLSLDLEDWAIVLDSIQEAKKESIEGFSNSGLLLEPMSIKDIRTTHPDISDDFIRIVIPSMYRLSSFITNCLGGYSLSPLSIQFTSKEVERFVLNRVKVWWMMVPLNPYFHTRSFILDLLTEEIDTRADSEKFYDQNRINRQNEKYVEKRKFSLVPLFHRELVLHVIDFFKIPIPEKGNIEKISGIDQRIFLPLRFIRKCPHYQAIYQNIRDAEEAIELIRISNNAIPHYLIIDKESPGYREEGTLGSMMVDSLHNEGQLTEFLSPLLDTGVISLRQARGLLGLDSIEGDFDRGNNHERRN